MEKIFTRRNHGNKNWMVLIIAVVFICVSCYKQPKKNNDGMVLTKFEIIDSRINEILDTAISDFIPNPYPNEDVFILEAIKLDTMSVFITSLLNKKTISEMYIFRNNKRILGYTERHGHDIILLTTTQKFYDVEANYSNYIVPTDSSRFFDYIYFPNNMYNDFETGKPIKGWNNVTVLYDPLFCINVYDKSRKKWFVVSVSRNLSPYLNKDSINKLKERIDIYYDENGKFIPQPKS